MSFLRLQRSPTGHLMNRISDNQLSGLPTWNSAIAPRPSPMTHRGSNDHVTTSQSPARYSSTLVSEGASRRRRRWGQTTRAANTPRRGARVRPGQQEISSVRSGCLQIAECRIYRDLDRAIHSSIRCSRISSGSAPPPSTSSWNARMSNLAPRASLAFVRSREIVSCPIL
jgi:hypothetical protein